MAAFLPAERSAICARGRRRRTAVCLRDAQPIALDLGFALHACHERFVSQIDLLAQSLPNILSYAFVHESPIPTPCFFPRRAKLAQESPSTANQLGGGAHPAHPGTANEPAIVNVPGGCFQMGSLISEPERDDDEQQYRVCVQAVAIGQYEVTFEEYDRFAQATYEVTQAQWRVVMDVNPARFQHDDQPGSTSPGMTSRGFSSASTPRSAASPTACPARPSGNTPPGAGPRPPIGGARR